MLRRIDPEKMIPHDAGFSHAVVIPAGAEVLHTTGQAGWLPDGSIPTDPAEQCRTAFANIGTLLEEAGMAVTDLVKLTAHVRDLDVVEPYRIARDAFLAGARPASTVLVAGGFVLPGMAIELEAIAARVSATPIRHASS